MAFYPRRTLKFRQVSDMSKGTPYIRHKAASQLPVTRPPQQDNFSSQLDENSQNTPRTVLSGFRAATPTSSPRPESPCSTSGNTVRALCMQKTGGICLDSWIQTSLFCCPFTLPLKIKNRVRTRVFREFWVIWFYSMTCSLTAPKWGGRDSK